jgi:Zn-dependent protease with chaperone function
MTTLASRLRTNKERLYGAAMIAAGVVLWPLVLLGIWSAVTNPNPQVAVVGRLYLFYGLAFAAFCWISSGLYRATAFGNMVLLGPTQFPELHAMVGDTARELGMSTPPRAFLYNSNGLINAFARRLFGGRFVFLTSALVEASSDEQVRFIVGHELGHHASGHLNPWLNALKLPGYAVPFLQPAYSRAREYTCDAIGAHLSDDLPVSRSALMMLGCGCRRLNGAMNCEAFTAQEAMAPPVFGFLSEIFRSHPRLTRRLRALRERGAAMSA